MKKTYPYLADLSYEDSNTRAGKREYLSQIDNFINQKVYVNIILLDWDENPIKNIEGEITSGTLTKDGSSSVRATCSLTCDVNAGDYNTDSLMMDYSINKKIYLELGVRNDTDKYPEYPILWFPQGVFIINSISINSSSSSAVSLSLSLKDKMALLDGTVGGIIPATTILDEMTEQSDDGTIYDKKVLIYDLIMELVNHYGEESLDRIVIEDVDAVIKRAIRWRGDDPCYMVLTGSGQDYYWDFYAEKPSDVDSVEYQYNEDIGYCPAEFVYDTELTASAGDSVCTILDKIKSYLGNYEYFYDEYGVFHFREIKNYLNVTQATTAIEEMLNSSTGENYLTISDNSKSVYTFSDNSNLVSVTNTPQYENIKNDFLVLREADNDHPTEIRYHVVIDDRPQCSSHDEVVVFADPDISYESEEDAVYTLGIYPEIVKKLGDYGNIDYLYCCKGNSNKSETFSRPETLNDLDADINYDNLKAKDKDALELKGIQNFDNRENDLSDSDSIDDYIDKLDDDKDALETAKTEYENALGPHEKYYDNFKYDIETICEKIEDYTSSQEVNQTRINNLELEPVCWWPYFEEIYNNINDSEVEDEWTDSNLDVMAALYRGIKNMGCNGGIDSNEKNEDFDNDVNNLAGDGDSSDEDDNATKAKNIFKDIEGYHTNCSCIENSLVIAPQNDKSWWYISDDWREELREIRYTCSDTNVSYIDSLLMLYNDALLYNYGTYGDKESENYVKNYANLYNYVQELLELKKYYEIDDAYTKYINNLKWDFFAAQKDFYNMKEEDAHKRETYGIDGSDDNNYNYSDDELPPDEDQKYSFDGIDEKVGVLADAVLDIINKYKDVIDSSDDEDGSDDDSIVEMIELISEAIEVCNRAKLALDNDGLTGRTIQDTRTINYDNTISFWVWKNEWVEVPWKVYYHSIDSDILPVGIYSTKDYVSEIEEICEDNPSEWIDSLKAAGYTVADDEITVPSQYKALDNNQYTAKDYRTEIILQGLEANYFATDNASYYFEELYARWGQIYDFENQEFYGQETEEYYNGTDANTTMHYDLTLGNYYFDMIDSTTAEVGQYCVRNIGRRTLVDKAADVNCLFWPDVPDILYIYNDQKEEMEEWCDELLLGQDYNKCYVNGNTYSQMATGGTSTDAYTIIKYDLLTHTMYQNTISLTALPCYYLEPNSRVRVEDFTTKTYGDYIVSNISIPLGAGQQMSISASKAFEKM